MDHVKWEINFIIFAKLIKIAKFAQMINYVDGVEVVNNVYRKIRQHVNVLVIVLNNGFMIINNANQNMQCMEK